MSWKLAGDIAYSLATLGLWIFVGVYGLGAPWYRTEAGRNIMGMMAVLTFICTYFGWTIWNGGVPPAIFPIRFLLFSGFAYFTVRRSIILVRSQFLERRKKRENYVEDAR